MCIIDSNVHDLIYYLLLLLLFHRQIFYTHRIYLSVTWFEKLLAFKRRTFHACYLARVKEIVDNAVIIALQITNT